MPVAVRIVDLAKRYQLGESRYYSDRLTESLVGLVSRFRVKERTRKTRESLWALDGLSFDVQEGDVVGIIGRNGAGKTTLLKILSRITEPTKGRVEIHGRVGSLLEVGTGFHPELTGRENVRLNGAILGMSRKEVLRRFDEIVDFAEVEAFIDTPVKRYSSGMQVRLAFAVAAHMEPEVLIVDEVLAVGDAAFQKKCIGKMDAVGREGRTVIFVSHDMGAVSNLTSKVAYLERGKLVAWDDTRKMVTRYLSDVNLGGGTERREISFFRRDSAGDRSLLITDLRVAGFTEDLPVLDLGISPTLLIEVTAAVHLAGVQFNLILRDDQGRNIAVAYSMDTGFAVDLKPGTTLIALSLDHLILSPGRYFGEVGVTPSPNAHAFDVLIDVPIFEIKNTGEVTAWLERPWGVVHPRSVQWTVIQP